MTINRGEKSHLVNAKNPKEVLTMALKQVVDAKGYTKDIRLFGVARHQVEEGLQGLGMLSRFASDTHDAKLEKKIDNCRTLLSEICKLID